MLLATPLVARQRVLASESSWLLDSQLIARNADVPWSSPELLVYSSSAMEVIERADSTISTAVAATRFKLTGGRREDQTAPDLGEATTLQLIKFVE